MIRYKGMWMNLKTYLKYINNFKYTNGIIIYK